MRIGVLAAMHTPLFTPDVTARVAQACETAGFDSFWTPEHVVLFDEYSSTYPYDESGKFPVVGESGLMDPFVGLPFVAAHTSTIKIATGICLVPQRQPIYTAKMVATLDVLSGGRFIFGVGVGWLREEFEALQMPFEHRGSVCRDYLGVMKSLWCDPVSSYEGRYYRLPPCRMYPKPVQKPHPPIYFGGEGEAALRRVADLGQGWFGFNLLPDETEPRVKRLEALLRERGRTRAEVDFGVSPYMKPITFDDVERYAEIGIDLLIVTLYGPTLDATLAEVDRLQSAIIEPAKRL